MKRIDRMTPEAGSQARMPSQISPATLEGWYALHQMFSFNWTALRVLGKEHRAEAAESAERLFAQLDRDAQDGWTAAFRLVGAGADWMFVHFRSTLEELAEVERTVKASPLGEMMKLEYDYLSVTEAGLYHATAEAAREAEPGSDEFRRRIDEAAAAERASAHVQTRLFPRVPEEMRYVSFYPMSKRRAVGQNWYALDVQERSRLMREHGMTGRRFAGRIFQVITGSVGLDDWEWGVTLFARDPLDFKRIVTDMRYDEASSIYGEFGRFFTGIRFAPGDWPALLGV
jgi:hydrogen peroxide-dependent heme synthase